MLKRHADSSVMGGVYVFPGGKLDPADAEVDAVAHLDREPGELRDSFGDDELTDEAAASLYVAAVRELFEESGLLLAEGMTDAAAAQATAHAREGHSFNELLEHFRLRLRTREMQGWTRWITPKIPSLMTKRFDTRFFIARLPEGLSPRHDNHEAVDSEWFRPRSALEKYWRGEIKMAAPQLMTLAHLSRHATVESALAEARSRKPPLVQPEHIEHEGDRVLLYPGDKLHPVAQRALPGPSRLTIRNLRYEPDEGFEGWFS